jgi:PAS domain S-box-containing protein
MKEKLSEERINEFIDSIIKVARGDYSVQVELSDESDSLDALAMGINMMVDDLRKGKSIELENEKIRLLNAELQAAKERAEESELKLRLKNEELENRNIFIQTILDHLPIGLALNSINDGHRIYMNKKFEEIYGWTSDEITSIESFFENVYPDKAYREQLIERIMTDINSGDPERMHWENISVTRKDETKRIVDAVNIPLLKQNTMVSTAMDVTALHQIQNDLIMAKEKAEEGDRLKSAFLANMSHEVRTPLNSIIGFSELLADPDFDEHEKNEFIQHIISNGNNLLNIISDIVDISKLETGKVTFHIKHVNACQFISKVYDRFSMLAVTKNIELVLTLPHSVEEIFVLADTDRLSQVFNNLIGNALKFTIGGYIEIGYLSQGNKVEFFVKDTGIGIPVQYQDIIFDRFRQVEEDKTRKYGGNGLGLAISKNLVELMSGNIWVKSQPGHGSEFYFTLPAE